VVKLTDCSASGRHSVCACAESEKDRGRNRSKYFYFACARYLQPLALATVRASFKRVLGSVSLKLNEVVHGH
jgi:hypothetical protein